MKCWHKRNHQWFRCLWFFRLFWSIPSWLLGYNGNLRYLVIVIFCFPSKRVTVFPIFNSAPCCPSLNMINMITCLTSIKINAGFKRATLQLRRRVQVVLGLIKIFSTPVLHESLSILLGRENKLGEQVYKRINYQFNILQIDFFICKSRTVCSTIQSNPHCNSTVPLFPCFLHYQSYILQITFLIENLF